MKVMKVSREGVGYSCFAKIDYHFFKKTLLKSPSILKISNFIGGIFMSDIVKEGTLLWEPSTSFKNQTNIAHYMKWLKTKHQLSFDNYSELWNWSVTHTAEFW